MVLYLQHMLLGDAKEETFGKHWTPTLDVSRMFPCLHTHTTYVEEAEFSSQEQKMMFCFLPFAHLSKTVSNIDTVSAAMFSRLRRPLESWCIQLDRINIKSKAIQY